MFMGVNYFTEEQVKELEKNPYVKKVSNKSITYAKEFKELYWIDYQNGIQPIEIFKKYGFDPNVLGAKRRNTFTERLKKQTQRVEGFKDTRKRKDKIVQFFVNHLPKKIVLVIASKLYNNYRVKKIKRTIIDAQSKNIIETE